MQRTWWEGEELEDWKESVEGLTWCHRNAVPVIVISCI